MGRLLSELNPRRARSHPICGSLAAHAVGVALFAGCLIAALLLPTLKMEFFCQPSAWLASLFLGTPCIESPGGFLLPHAAIDILVVESCSGFDFFALLYAVLGAIAVRRASRSGIQLALLLPLSFAVTILANCVRIVSAVQARLFADLLPHAASPAAIHLIVGVTVFVLFLAVACLLVSSIYAKH